MFRGGPGLLARHFFLRCSRPDPPALRKAAASFSRMTLVAKILAALAAFCFLVWGAVLAIGVQPIVSAPEIRIVYGEHEEFHADGAAFRGTGNGTFFIVHLPHASPGRQWWTIDFQEFVIAESRPLRSLQGRRYLIRSDLDGAKITAEDHARTWLWHFAGNEASFAGREFVCQVRKISGGGSRERKPDTDQP